MGNVTITCIVSCDSAENLRHSEKLARGHIALDNTVLRTFVAAPGGKEQTTCKVFRLGDYFDSIQLTHEPGGLCFKLVFQTRYDAAPYWKDLLMAVLRDIRSGTPGLVVQFSQKS